MRNGPTPTQKQAVTLQKGLSRSRKEGSSVWAFLSFLRGAALKDLPAASANMSVYVADAVHSQEVRLSLFRSEPSACGHQLCLASTADDHMLMAPRGRGKDKLLLANGPIHAGGEPNFFADTSSHQRNPPLQLPHLWSPWLFKQSWPVQGACEKHQNQSL